MLLCSALILLLGWGFNMPSGRAATRKAPSDDLHILSLNHYQTKLYYDTHGRFLCTSEQISDESLPLEVIQALMRRYPNRRFDRILHFKGPAMDAYLMLLESDQSWTELSWDAHAGLRERLHLDKQP